MSVVCIMSKASKQEISGTLNKSPPVAQFLPWSVGKNKCCWPCGSCCSDPGHFVRAKKVPTLGTKASETLHYSMSLSTSEPGLIIYPSYIKNINVHDRCSMKSFLIHNKSSIVVNTRTAKAFHKDVDRTSNNWM